MRQRLSKIAIAALLLLGLPAKADEADTAALYKKYCAECHGEDRLGRQGPALLPQNLKRLRKKRALGVIAKGRPATQMPAFGESLDEAQITALANLIFTPLAKQPVWGEEEIEEKRGG